MFCKQCGTQNVEEARFCKECGEPLDSAVYTNIVTYYENTEEKTAKKQNKKSLYYFVGAIIIVVALIIAISIGFRGKRAKEYEQYIASAEKYIEELNFEQAKDYYLQAIHVAPKELEPYIRLAQICVDEGDIEKAESILKWAVDERASGTEEIEEEAEKVRSAIKELKNGISYDWIVEPTIEADDIYYVKYSSENYEEPTNIMNRQVYEPYAVIEKDEALGLIDMDGEMVLETKYKEIQQYYGQYLLKTVEPEYSTEIQAEWDRFIWDETYGLQAVEGFGDEGRIAFYYCDNLYNTANDYEMYEIPVPDEAMPVLITDKIYDEYHGDMIMKNMWLEKQEKTYGIYYQGQLLDDGTYDKYGSESEGLLAVCKDGKWGYINYNGNVIIPLEYDASWDKYEVGDVRKSINAEFCYAASDGYVVLCKDNQWELRDVTGKIAIPAGEFEAIRPVYEGKCWAKQDGKWGVLELVELVVNGENNDVESNSTISEELLYGSWYQDSPEAMKLLMVEDKSILYYSLEAKEDEFNTTWSVEDDILSIDLVNLDSSGVTTVKYQINYEEIDGIKQMKLKLIDDGTDVSKLYGYDKTIEGTYRWFAGFTEEQIEQIKENLRVPKDADVQVDWEELYVWDAADRYVTNVNFYENSELVACTGLDPWTIEFMNNTYVYKGGE